MLFSNHLGDYPNGSLLGSISKTALGSRAIFFVLMEDNIMQRRCFTISEAAFYLSISRKSLQRNKDIIPIKIGHLTRYDKETLDEYITKRASSGVKEVVG